MNLNPVLLAMRRIVRPPSYVPDKKDKLMADRARRVRLAPTTVLFFEFVHSFGLCGNLLAFRLKSRIDLFSPFIHSSAPAAHGLPERAQRRLFMR
jgi:hypothetical protein